MKARLETMRWACMCLLVTGTMVSCVDDEYDLSKDIDMTVTVGGSNLVIPASSTEPITLKKIFDLDENDDQALKTAKAGNSLGLNEGDYYLYEESGEDGTRSTIDVDRVTVDFDEMVADEMRLEFPKVFANGLESVDQVINLSTRFNLNQDEVTGQLRELDWLRVDAPVELTLQFNPQGSNVSRLSVKEGFRITFPSYVTLETEARGWRIDEQHPNVVVATEDILCNRNGGAYLEVQITKMDFMHPDYPAEQRLHPGVPVAGTDTYEDGYIHMVMQLYSDGYMSLSKSDFPASEELVKVDMQVVAHMGEVEVVSVVGIVDPDFHVTVEPVDFIDVPDFLDDPETNIDLADPRIFLTITNESPIGMNVHAVLKPLDEDGRVMTDIHGNSAEVRISASDNDRNALVVRQGTTRFELSVTGTQTDPGATPVKVENLSKLIARVPARIAVEEVKPNALQEMFELYLNRKYRVNTDYEIMAPIAFGRDLNFVYRDTLDGWQEDLEDFELSQVEVELTAHNQIPMQMELEAVALDAEGNPLSDVTVTTTGNIPASDGVTVETGTLKLSIDASHGTIRNLDGLQLLVRGVSTEQSAGKRLNDRQTLQFTGVKLHIKDGITLDLN
ncbi:MAG: hypothetical protein NC388_07590 [Clostridium sp.]|nr:hypothetical protein [Clostridium sp.]